MSDLVVITYENDARAAEALAKVVTLKQENVQKALISIEDAATATKDENGKVRVRQTLEAAMKGGNVMSGGMWGLLIGFLFGGPLFGTLLGMGLSALFGRKVDIGIDNQFIDRISNELNPGESVLFLLVGDTDPEKIGDALAEFGGKLYHTSLSEEATGALADAMDHAPIRDAVEAHNAE